MSYLWHNTGANHIKSSGALERHRYPLSTCVRGARTMQNHTPIPYYPENLIDYAPWVSMYGLFAPYGICQCGCGQPTPPSKKNVSARGWRKNAPIRFVAPHNHPYTTPETEFWRRVERGHIESCWEWKGTINNHGYGKLQFGKKAIQAHRLSYMIHYGPIPATMCVCHRCDNTKCVNPHHLFLGTDLDNSRDRDEKGRTKSTFPGGTMHPGAKLTEDDINTIRSLGANGLSRVEIAAQFGVSSTTISRILRGESYKDAAL